ncbi:DoxX family protein [Bacillus aquiflavi]|uniref:DoxX family protein n=1 Tax=Bacillus aquiflavi TaxID=2672567 RepID=A0A6B3W4Z2_9BACI|nr:DoxX family protein [Bacillus aquiflavi]MBA4538663.1 DoxX family protein [Bacillus aquiflavi]NEY83023.1 DoxX family protein [Bacillus aquiflavi]UAC48877.1 DoxX family protein [Bacillus aquiflavi]
MGTLAIILQIILGLGFLLFGVTKFISKQMVEAFEHFGLPQWLRVITGSLEIIGALGLFVGIWYSIIAVLSSVGLAIIMFFAALTHIRSHDPFKNMLMPIILFILLVTVTFLI